MTDGPARPSRLELLGVPFDPVSQGQALDTIRSFLDTPGFHLVVTLGTEMVMHAQKDQEFLQTCREAALVVADGMGVVWASRANGHKVPERLAGIELVQALSASLGPRLRIFLLGAAPGVAEEAASALRASSPGLQIVGVHDGFFKDDEAVVATIAASGANLVLAGLGFPRQERWLSRFGPSTGARVGIGVGGSFDVLSGRVERAPRWMARYGLEWLYRFAKQPTRWRRMLALPAFVVKVISRGRLAVRGTAFAQSESGATVSPGENIK